MASPVAVPDALPLPDDELDELAVAVAVAAGVVVVAVAVWTAGVWAWKARTPAVPATVAAMTMGDRFMGCFGVRRRRTRSGSAAWSRPPARARRRAPARTARARRGSPRGGSGRGRAGAGRRR